MSYDTLQLEIAGEVATITLNRPDKRNAISTQMIEELLVALEKIEMGAARVAIITGSGKAFCAGMDLDVLRSLAGQSFEQNLADSRLHRQTVLPHLQLVEADHCRGKWRGHRRRLRHRHTLRISRSLCRKRSSATPK